MIPVVLRLKSLEFWTKIFEIIIVFLFCWAKFEARAAPEQTLYSLINIHPCGFAIVHCSKAARSLSPAGFYLNLWWNLPAKTSQVARPSVYRTQHPIQKLLELLSLLRHILTCLFLLIRCNYMIKIGRIKCGINSYSQNWRSFWSCRGYETI